MRPSGSASYGALAAHLSVSPKTPGIREHRQRHGAYDTAACASHRTVFVTRIFTLIKNRRRLKMEMNLRIKEEIQWKR